MHISKGKHPTTHSHTMKIYHVCFNHIDSPALLQVLHEQIQAWMHKITHILSLVLKHSCQCKTPAHSQVNTHTQDVHLHPHLSQTHSSWHGGLMYIKFIQIHEVLICSLFTLSAILTNSNPSMHLCYMSIKIKIPEVMAHSRHLKWTGGVRDSSREISRVRLIAWSFPNSCKSAKFKVQVCLSFQL